MTPYAPGSGLYWAVAWAEVGTCADNEITASESEGANDVGKSSTAASSFCGKFCGQAASEKQSQRGEHIKQSPRQNAPHHQEGRKKQIGRRRKRGEHRHKGRARVKPRMSDEGDERRQLLATAEANQTALI